VAGVAKADTCNVTCGPFSHESGDFASPGQAKFGTTIHGPIVQRVNVIVSKNGMVGDNEGDMVNAERDVRLALDRLFTIGAITESVYDSVLATISQPSKKGTAKAKGSTRIVPVAKLTPITAAINAICAEQVGITPKSAYSLLGILLESSVGAGLANHPSDVKLLLSALNFEGLATYVTADSKSWLPAVCSGIADLKFRILTGVRPEGPRIRDPLGSPEPTSINFDRFSESPVPGLLPWAQPPNVNSLLNALSEVPEWTLLTWPKVLAQPTGKDDSLSLKKSIFAQISLNRQRIPLRDDVKIERKGETAKKSHEGIVYTRSAKLLRAGAEPAPTTLEEGSPSRTASNAAAWNEVLTEGSAGSGNAYDQQYMTVGRGFGVADEQGGETLRDFFKKDPSAESALLHIGFAMDGTTPVVVDVEHERLLRGVPALRYIEKDRSVYTQFSNTGEAPSHIMNMTNAQFGVLRRHAAKVPQEVLDGGIFVGPKGKTVIKSPWGTDVLRFGVHAQHFAPVLKWHRLIQEGTDKDGRGDINKLAALVLPHCGGRSKHGAGMLWNAEDTRVLEWGNRIVGRQLGAMFKELPNIDTVVAGTRYFLVQDWDEKQAKDRPKYKEWKAGVSLASE
jgi:hypothetical protein